MIDLRSAGSVLIVALLVLAACSGADELVDAEEGSKPNILLLIADDYGVESSSCYPVLGTGEGAGSTPQIDALCAEGMVYENAWSSPTCSPTRSGILTGRHGFRTGVGEQATRDNNIEIGADEQTLPRVLDAADSGYRHASFGKWHLGGALDNPNTMGWSHFSGLFAGALQDYNSWTKTVNGEEIVVEEYATTEIVDDALEWITSDPEPWLAWVAFNAPHTPFHLPPAELHSAELSGTSADIESNPAPYYEAAVEALDAEIGRLLDSLAPDVRSNTVVIFIGDNGSPGQVSSYEQGQAKGGLYEGGIHVPMVVTGPGVSVGRSGALVGTVDLFSTVLEIAGVDVSTALVDAPLDSVSFGPTLQGVDGTNDVIMAEIFGSATRPNRQGKTIRNERYKVIEFTNGRTEFFDLETDPRGEQAIESADRTASEAATFEELLDILRAWSSDPTAPRPT